MKQFRSKFLMTVPESLYQATCAEVDQAFADTYLPGARLEGQYLHPRTLTGWDKMRDRQDFGRLLKRLEITMVKPLPYPGEGDRMSAQELNRGA